MKTYQSTKYNYTTYQSTTFKVLKCNKDYNFAGDFKLNLLDHDKRKKVQDFLDLKYRNGMIPTINKPARVTKKLQQPAINCIITNSFAKNNFKAAIMKSNISDYFPIFIFVPSTILFTKNSVIYLYKRIIADEKTDAFLQNIY